MHRACSCATEAALSRPLACATRCRPTLPRPRWTSPPPNSSSGSTQCRDTVSGTHGGGRVPQAKTVSSAELPWSVRVAGWIAVNPQGCRPFHLRGVSGFDHRLRQPPLTPPLSGRKRLPRYRRGSRRKPEKHLRNSAGDGEHPRVLRRPDEAAVPPTDRRGDPRTGAGRC